ncbi:hypothetical protein TWF173_002185 [Orbilia oligospora]|uniref:C2H2-type domain-containing protein n=1 Tax=Orbilia oligospora TaxID=2813651 RepID=A0A7C8VPK1_ORBOL|nr:hypothetical protein TWF970_007285 [Orbilia oligospora]KAF3316337.1 hypothetical protein TWF173_002185 [Orbilia oligospora]
MSTSSTPVVRPRASRLPVYPPTVVAASTTDSNQTAIQAQNSFHFAPTDLICSVRCCQPGCQSESDWLPATQLTFYVEELNDDPILCGSCINVRYPNILAEQCSPVWIPEARIAQQMFRIVCRESRSRGIPALPSYITDKEEIVSPRSLFVQPLWRAAMSDESNRRIYICPECNRDFRKQSRYIRHVSEHINLYQCRHCQQPKARVEDTKNHLIRTCLPRHYPNVHPSRFDGDEDDQYHYSRHYRWRTNREFLTDSREHFPNHHLGLYPALVYDLNTSVVPPNYYPDQGLFQNYP